MYKEEIAHSPLCKTILCKDDYRQIWRNHLLGATMVMNGQISRFHSLTLYPKGNPHFRKVLPEYESTLSAYGKATFGYLTIEDLIVHLAQCFEMTDKNKGWIDYLNTRYPFV